MIVSKGQPSMFVTLALLRNSNGDDIRYFSNAQEIVEFLRKYPDQQFILDPVEPLNVFPTQPRASGVYGPENGDVFLGTVAFDSNSETVICC